MRLGSPNRASCIYRPHRRSSRTINLPLLISIAFYYVHNSGFLISILDMQHRHSYLKDYRHVLLLKL
ncbi:hypothetical protein BDV38DRAFT_240957 [Aspergillus pseudotamarii]|uniref:Uncharacterized protein n=1 Tax=Aspergillus pseudotamarii TaxID=132259 RepID=A0A5N6T172_ASPPS|nr:uncharacterized protein BDV38DRAFT_240957 [Aspergillus pseudotamarii]KAE8140080.1 hypothetical protein BDV38DRAFT_240957 [Aspergillus pseudotamarii]